MSNQTTERMTCHHLKTWPWFFARLRDRSKTFEVRKNDRDFKVGDTLSLEEWNPDTKEFTGQYEFRKISYMVTGAVDGVEPGYAVLGFAPGAGTKPAARRCMADMNSDPPRDCDAPYCGCDPAWEACMEMLRESGWKSPDELQSPEPRANDGYGSQMDRDSEAARIELAGLIPVPDDPEEKEWPCENPADRECLHKAYMLLLGIRQRRHSSLTKETKP